MLKNLRTPLPSLRYGIALMAVAIALLLTLPLSPLLKPTIFPLFFVAVMVSAWYGGLRSGLLATGVAAVAIAYFFIPAPGVLADVDALSRLALFVLVALLTSLVASGWKHANQALQESELRFRSVAQSASDAVIVADSLGNIVVWNITAQKMFGYQEAEVLGKPVTLLMPVRYRDAHSKGLERLRTTGESRLIGKTVELHGLRKDGQEFPLELSVAAWQSELSRRDGLEELVVFVAPSRPGHPGRLIRDLDRRLQATRAATQFVVLTPEELERRMADNGYSRVVDRRSR